MICSQWHHCVGSSECPDCPSKHKNPVQYTSVLLPSGRNRRVKFASVPSTVQLDLFGGAL